MNRPVQDSFSIAEQVRNNQISCTSMVVTVFGDIVSAHGGWIWLGSLIQALEPFGFSKRLVRTAVYRLVQSNWLRVDKIGRRSYYSFTAMARGHFEKAARRIYPGQLPEWDGHWIMVAPTFIPEEKKELFRKSLLWQGFNTLVTGLYAHPSSDRKSLDEIIHEQGLVGEVIVLLAKTEDDHSLEAIKKQVQNRWDLSELEIFYGKFLQFYRPIYQRVLKKCPGTQESFLLRVLLIHEYRRILLRDPDFPDALLPQNWVGHEAYAVVKRLYTLLAGPSSDYIASSLENAQGNLPTENAQFSVRFGGLQ